MFLNTISYFCDKPANGTRQWNLFILLTLVISVFTSETIARELESIDHIEKEIKDYLAQNLKADTDTKYEIGYLDQRLKLDKCSVPMEIFQPVGAKQSGFSSLGVRCQGNKRWKIHVPVKIIRFTNVLTAKQTLTRGSYLNAQNVQSTRMDISRIKNGYFTSRTEIAGMVVKRDVKRSQVITSNMLEIPKLVKRGEIVTILANTSTLSIRVKGKALMDGRKNEIIRVRNDGSNKEIQARVISPGIVRVSM